ncbi:hypothetical protein K1719_041606 [Acacia pycnantha]|nr:hypothetical protein K1719_041606 [Acacia pycnantha]
MLFTAVYANPNEHQRIRLWDLLNEIANNVEEPWMLAGDFNEIKSPMEQKGGGRTSEVRCRRFQAWIQECNLIDLDVGGPFLHGKGQNGRLNGQNQVYRARNFRYEAMWQMHGNFVEVVNESWKGEYEAHVKLNRLQENLICWNREVFGRIATRKKQLFNRLYGIQKSIERYNNPFLINLEAELEEELMATLRQEEILWFQKSRGKWLEDGDRNTGIITQKQSFDGGETV